MPESTKSDNGRRDRQIYLTLGALITVAEAATKPGLMSPVGVRREAACARDLARYFRVLAELVMKREPQKAAAVDHPEAAQHMADLSVAAAIRTAQPLLRAALELHIAKAMLEADKLSTFHEADPSADASTAGSIKPPKKPTAQPTVVDQDKLGLSGQEAAEYAATRSAQLVTGIDATTRAALQKAVSTGITDRLGVDGLGRLIRRTVMDMSVGRAKLIASTEMNDAMSEAALRKMRRLEVGYKRLVLAPGACDICAGIAADGPVPVDEPFEDDDGETYMRTPIHPWCRCATVPSRPPAEE